MAVECAIDENSDTRRYFIYLEWFIHGIPWLITSSLSFIVLMRQNADPEITYDVGVILFGICIDLIAVGIIKCAVRRERPHYNKNDQVYEAPIADQYSFPSGHSSRSAMLSVFGYCHFSMHSLIM
ncbi:unnamed protein product [Anisakis simplex]|uniref:Phosphatidic acid phosphatase type 2/haloperoxidase domain-containing protein n=1 Tax=Anisakis simplex TaxID=6269 RepID=A0A3P6N7W1_ANISI|nr:unnamed protein product [Anisakis simplex]